MSDIAAKINEKRQALEDLSESDLPISDVAADLLEIADET